jgi:hypothetical protein
MGVCTRVVMRGFSYRVLFFTQALQSRCLNCFASLFAFVLLLPINCLGEYLDNAMAVPVTLGGAFAK